MKRRPISTPKQLGAAIYDARTAAGMTQAALAARAGVSRKWLIGLEQGSRTGAELAKILNVLHALGLAIQLSEAQEIRKSSPEGDGTPDSELRPDYEAEGKAHPRSAGKADAIGASGNTAALNAIKDMRTNLSGNTAALNAIRDMQVHFTGNTAALNAIKDMRTNLSGNTAALNAIRDMQVHFTGNTAALDAIKDMRTNFSGNTAALNAIRRATSQLNTSAAALSATHDATDETSHKGGPELENQGDKD